jgi:hypothetical protein
MDGAESSGAEELQQTGKDPAPAPLGNMLEDDVGMNQPELRRSQAAHLAALD